MRGRTLQERFFAKVKRSETSDCLEWTGCINQWGYGTFRNTTGAGTLAHRVSYELEKGPFDYRLLVCHKCDNPKCVNHEHLFLGTNMDNRRDCVTKQRHHVRRGSEHRWSKLDEAQVKLIIVLMACGAVTRDIAKWFGVCQATISHISRGKNWRQVYA